MSNVTKNLLSLALCAATSTTATAGVPFDQMIAFGASYEDNGQFPDIDFFSLAFPAAVPPPGAGLDGSTGFRVTNLDPASGERGRAWVERLSSDLGIGGLVPSTPLLFPGERTDIPNTQNINFAYATARSVDQLEAVVGQSQVTHPIDDLVEADLSATGPGFVQRLESGALTTSQRTPYVANPAGNDVRDASIEDPAQDGVIAARNSLAVIDALVAAGARNILRPTFPPLGQLSESSNVAPDGS